MPIWLPIVILAMIFYSWLQMKNVILILIFKFQDFSMVYWGFDLKPCLLFTLLFQRFQTLMGVHLPKWFHLGMFKTHFFTFSHTCGCVRISGHSPNPHLFSCPNFCCEFKINVMTIWEAFLLLLWTFPILGGNFCQFVETFSIAW